VGWVAWAAGKAGWYFFAWGPQLLLCLYLGYLSAKKTGGAVLDWLVAAFIASLIPIGGVIVMLAVWWRAGDPDAGGAHDEDAEKRGPGDAGAGAGS
jgi:hypothetical protein